MIDSDIIEALRERVEVEKRSKWHSTHILGLLARLVCSGQWRAKSNRGDREFIEIVLGEFIRTPCDAAHVLQPVAPLVVCEAFRLAAEALR